MRQIPATGATNQVIIYAKHWYGKTDKGAVVDIQTLMKRYSACPMSEGNAKELIIGAFAAYGDRHGMREGLLNAMGLGVKAWLNMEIDPYAEMVAQLAIIKGKFVDMPELLDLSLDGACIKCRGYKDVENCPECLGTGLAKKHHCP